MSLGKRIKTSREAKRLSQATVASEMGVAQSAVSSWEKDINEPTLSVIGKLAKMFEVPAAWLALGAGPEHFAEGERVTEVNIKAGLGAGGFTDCEFNQSDEYANITTTEGVVGTWEFPAGYLRSELRVQSSSVKIIEVEGDSMEPTLMSGDRVMVDTSRRIPSPPGVFAIWDGMATVVKRLDHIQNTDPPEIEISSDNSARHKTRIRTVDEVNVIGRVVWFARKL